MAIEKGASLSTAKETYPQIHFEQIDGFEIARRFIGPEFLTGISHYNPQSARQKRPEIVLFAKRSALSVQENNNIPDEELNQRAKAFPVRRQGFVPDP